MLKTFPKGIHPAGNKELAKDIPISEMSVQPTLFVPLNQNIGKTAELVVKTGEKVKKGQLLAKADGFVSSNIFAPVSGTVKAVVNRLNITGVTGAHIEIENDFAEEEVTLPPLVQPSREELAKRITEAGIVGMGGAAFPTPVKLAVPEGKTVDTLVINAAECEPYITCDYRIMLELTEEFLYGVRLIAKVLGVNDIVIAMEDNKPDALQKVLAAADGITVVALKTKYPQGAEKQLVYAATGRRIPVGGLPADAHVVVQNVHTALTVYRAVKLGKPCYERIVTVSGRGIRECKNMWVRTGTLLSDIAAYCGGETGDVVKVLNGGPMMGVSQPNLNAAINKASSAVLFLTREEVNLEPAMACINCGRCAGVCPMNLMPMYIDGYTLVGEYGVAKRYGAASCIECGCCSYVCPAKRPLVQSIRLCKKLIRERNI